MRLSPVVLALLPGLAASSAYAAVYQVQELAETRTVQSQFSAALNDNGDVVGSGTFIYNFPVDVSSIDFESASLVAALTAEQIEQIKLGNISSASQAVLIRYLESNATNYRLQRYTDVIAFNLVTGEQVKIREQAAIPTNKEYLYDINNSGNAIGLATTTYTRQSFTPEATEETPSPQTINLWLPEPADLKSYVVNGNSVTPLPIPYEEFGGGFSVATKISQNNYIAGSGSVAMMESTQETIKTNCNGKAKPISLCYDDNKAGYVERALVWKINEAGQITAPVQYGILGPKLEETADRDYVSRASSVNDDGIAVGYSSYTDAARRINTVHATVFHDGELSSIVDPVEWNVSSAVDINNQNMIVGSASKNFNGLARNKLFIFDYNTKTLTHLEGFFNSSDTVPMAINENNMVVGSAEILPADGTTRRKVAFLYDIEKASFTDLNTLLPCGSTISLIEAKDINNNNEIVANAVVSVELRDYKGDLVKDSAGNPVMENVSRAVKLTPVPNGTIESCQEQQEENYERKGGSVNWFTLLLLPLLWLRRRVS